MPVTVVALSKPKRGRPPSKKKTEAEEAAREDAEAAKQDAGSEDAYDEQDDEVSCVIVQLKLSAASTAMQFFIKNLIRRT